MKFKNNKNLITILICIFLIATGLKQIEIPILTHISCFIMGISAGLGAVAIVLYLIEKRNS